VASDITTLDISKEVLDELSNVAAMTEAGGDLFYYDGSNWNRLAIGTAGKVLTSTGTAPQWSTDIAGNAGTATALATNPDNCASGQYPKGVTAGGVVESCTAISVTDISDATATPAASKIPIADGSGDLDDGWLPSGITRDSEVVLKTGGTFTGLVYTTPAIGTLSNWEEFEPQQSAEWLTVCDVKSVDGIADSCGSGNAEAVYDGSRYVYTTGGRVDGDVQQWFLIRNDTWAPFNSIQSWEKFDLASLSGFSGELLDLKFSGLVLVGEYLYIAPDPPSPYWVKYHLTADMGATASYTILQRTENVVTCGVDSYLTVTGHEIATNSQRYVRLDGTSGGSGACGLEENQEYYVYALNANRLFVATSYPFIDDDAITACSGTNDTITLTHAATADETRVMMSNNASACFASEGADSIISNHTYYLCSCNGTICKVQDTASGTPNGSGDCTAAVDLQCTDGAGCDATLPVADTLKLSAVGAGQPLTASPAANGVLQMEMGYRQLGTIGTDIYGASFWLDQYSNIATKLATATDAITIVDLDVLNLQVADADAGESDGFFGAISDTTTNKITFTPYGTEADKFIQLDTSVTFNQTNVATMFDVYDATAIGGAELGYHGGWYDATYEYYVPYGDGGSVHNYDVLKRDKSLAFDNAGAWSVAKDLSTINERSTGFWGMAETSEYVFLLAQWTPYATYGAQDIAMTYWTKASAIADDGSWQFVDLLPLVNKFNAEGKITDSIVAGDYLYVVTMGLGAGKGGNYLRFPLVKKQ